MPVDSIFVPKVWNSADVTEIPPVDNTFVYTLPKSAFDVVYVFAVTDETWRELAYVVTALRLLVTSAYVFVE